MSNKRVLVTGSSRGIGKAIALSLAKEGFSVVIHGRSETAALNKAAGQFKALGGDHSTLFFDVSNQKEAQSRLETHVNEYGAFYGVVLSAGIHRDGPFPGMSPDEWSDVLRCNLDSFYNVLHPLVMPMIQLRSGGRIVALSSLAGVSGNRGQVNYSASKAGLIGAAKALSKELAKRRISVNCVAPGFVETEMTETIPEEVIRQMVPMRRAGKPEEIAALVQFLFTEPAEYITGQTISINGGIA